MKYSQAEVDYNRGTHDAHCGPTSQDDTGYCKHFIDRRQTDGMCTIVEGRIGRAMWCTEFEKIK